jgi:hypothetical protein
MLHHAQIKRARLLDRRPLKRCIVLRLPIDARADAARDGEEQFIELHDRGACLSSNTVLLLAVLALQVRREGARILGALRLLGDQLDLELLLGLLRTEAIRAHQRPSRAHQEAHPHSQSIHIHRPSTFTGHPHSQAIQSAH